MSKKFVSIKVAALMASATLTMGVLGFVSPANAAIDCTTATVSGNGCIVLTVKTFGDVIQPNLVFEYRKMRPDVKLSIMKSDLDALNGTGLTSQCAAGGAGNPDIAAIEVAYAGLWRENSKCFKDLRYMKNKANRSALDIKKDYLPWRWNQGVAYDGKVIGIPTDVGGLQVAYRWDLFRKAGLPYTRDKVSEAWPTWSKFIEFGKRYVAKLTPKQKKANVGFIDNVGTIYPAIMNQGTEKYYRKNGTATGQLIYKSNPQVRRAFDKTIEASKAKIGSRVGQFSADWSVGMSKGTFAAVLAPAWMLGYIKDQAPATKGNWDVAKIPGGGGNLGGSQLTIPAGAKNAKEAWNFISWYLAPSQQLKVFKEYGLFPSTSGLYRYGALTSYKDDFFNNAPIGRIFADSVQKLKPIFEGKLERCIDMAMGSAISLVANGKETVPARAFSTGLAGADKCNKK